MRYIILSFFFFVANFSYTYALSIDDADKAKENTSIIVNFFTIDMLLNVVFALLVILMTFATSKLVNSKLKAKLESNYSGVESGREELVGVISRTVNIVILFIGFSITLSILGVDLGIFMGGIGFGIGFTMKAFLTNFISGIMMVTQGEYHIKDIVNIDGLTGKIIRINALYTTIEQFNGVMIHIPNIKFTEENVANYHSNDKRRIEIEIGVDYATDITKAKRVIEKVLDQFPNILQAPHPEIMVEKFGDSAIVLSIRFWINSKDSFFVMKSNVSETINLAFKQSDITIPFPQVTISNR